ncbi:MAG: NAD(P)-dependent alcohol dehydrogenase [Acidobacteria bacterium]|nr:NAD(P)-dependent alcohol dehydrogenase [Acidobacteriota bacterium]
MQALQLQGWQQPPALRDLAVPEPGPGQVVIRIGGAGACHSDLHMMDDFQAGQVAWQPPFTLGHENAGWVESLGAGVTGFEIGQPVAVYGAWGCGHCSRCRQGIENYCDNARFIASSGGGLGSDGGMAPYMLVPSARFLVPLNDLHPVDAAPLTDAGLTPYHAIKRSLSLLTPGSTAVVIGAGGLGHMAIQILGTLTSARVIAVDRSTDALGLAHDLGAHTVPADADAPRAIRELTKGKGADVVIDLVGATDTLALGQRVARSMGHLTLVGIAGGSVPFSFFSQSYEVAMANTYWGSITELMEVLALAEAGRIRAHVEKFTLANATDAYDKMRRGELRGRAVIVPE